MRERIGSIGRKFLLFWAIFFLGLAVSPPGWNFWDFLAEVSENPEIMKALLYGIAGFLVMLAIIHALDHLKKKE